MIITTNEEVFTSPDMCAFCRLNTAGEHEINCPCRIAVELREKKGIRILKYDDYGNFIKEI